MPQKAVPNKANEQDKLPVDLDDVFYCRARRRRLALHKCLDDYLEANAFDKRRTACWRCPQGRLNREHYAGGVVVDFDGDDDE